MLGISKPRRGSGAVCRALRLAFRCGLIGVTFGVATAAMAEKVNVTLGQAHSIGRQAFEQNNYRLAYSVAKQLLVARPDDVGALILLAASAPHIEKPKEGRIAGRKAFLIAKNPDQKLNAATYAAVASARETRPLVTQLWLRRAYQQAETDVQRDAIAKQYRLYSRTSPVRLSFTANISPSSNLNGGSDSRFLTIDGVYPIGVLNGAAQALSGVRASVSGRLTYTLSERPTHKTTLTFMGSASRVHLSGDARSLAPSVSDSDLADTQISTRLTHQIAHKGRPIPDTYSVTVGQTWFGGNAYYSYATIGASRSFRFGKRTYVRLGAEHTHQAYSETLADKGITSLRLGASRRLKTGDTLRANLSFSNANSDNNNSTYQSIFGSIGYEFGKPVGPANISASVSYGETTYDSYRIGFVQAPGGRTDKTTQAKLDFTFNDVSYLGFVPQVNVSHLRTTSNISRFERKTTGVGLSFVSAF